MISHKHKCIFIHISKCAGSSIENSFGIDIKDNSEKNNQNLYGWNQRHQLFLNHATPQQLFDIGLLNEELWNNYYKFIIVRNPWDRALSDYIWLSQEQNIFDTFKNFLNRRGKFEKILTVKNGNFYRGDHLNKQIDYFFLKGEKIKYNKILRFENLETELPELAKDLNLLPLFFDKKVNVTDKKLKHYSAFYNSYRKKLVAEKYSADIKFLGYDFTNKKNLINCLMWLKPSYYFLRK